MKLSTIIASVLAVIAMLCVADIGYGVLTGTPLNSGKILVQVLCTLVVAAYPVYRVAAFTTELACDLYRTLRENDLDAIFPDDNDKALEPEAPCVQLSIDAILHLVNCPYVDAEHADVLGGILKDLVLKSADKHA